MDSKIQYIPLDQIAKHKYLRNDFIYWNQINKIKYFKSIKIGELFSIINGISCSENYTQEITDTPFVRITDISLVGTIDRTKNSYLKESYRIPVSKILKKEDLVLAVIGSVGKIGISDNCVGGTASNNTVILRIKKNMKNEHIPYFYKYLFQLKDINNYLYNISSHKVQPNLQIYDLENAKLPLIPYNKQLVFLEKIYPIEKEISELTKLLVDDFSIINDIIIKEFNIQVAVLDKIERTSITYCDLYDFSKNTNSLRSSFRCNRAMKLQKIVLSNCKTTCNLGKLITKTQNGWSPECNNDPSGDAVLGLSSLNINTKLSYKDLKFTNKTRNNITKYYISDGDLLISRGNTPELVALASLARCHSKIENIIFPDLMIKIELNKEVLPEYVAYIFNSLIGRLFFKYMAKGKNQSMVKVSFTELECFIIPFPEISKQEEIIEKIKNNFKQQKLIKTEILERKDLIVNKLYEIIR